jgi:ribosomal protein S27E
MKQDTKGQNIERTEPRQTRRDVRCPECKGTLFVYTAENGQSTCQFCGFSIPVGPPEPLAASRQLGFK